MKADDFISILKIYTGTADDIQQTIFCHSSSVVNWFPYIRFVHAILPYYTKSIQLD